MHIHLSRDALDVAEALALPDGESPEAVVGRLLRLALSDAWAGSPDVRKLVALRRERRQRASGPVIAIHETLAEALDRVLTEGWDYEDAGFRRAARDAEAVLAEHRRPRRLTK